MIRVAGHFGELLQGRIGADGPVGLISLPCPALAVEAQRAPLGDPHGLLPPTRARALLSALDLADPGPFTLTATMPRGGGAGASTAALLALARLAGSDHPPEALARACVTVEGASDPLMFAAAERLLWASRQALVLERMPPLPRFAVIGGFHGPNRRTDPGDADFPDIADLLAPWRRAAADGDLAALAALASTSARRTLARRGPPDDPTDALARATGALGFVIAHTGSARGLIFPEGSIPKAAHNALVSAGFRRIVSFAAGGHVE